jgi:hypothetical protein
MCARDEVPKKQDAEGRVEWRRQRRNEQWKVHRADRSVMFRAVERAGIVLWGAREAAGSLQNLLFILFFFKITQFESSRD